MTNNKYNSNNMNNNSAFPDTRQFEIDGSGVCNQQNNNTFRLSDIESKRQLRGRKGDTSEYQQGGNRSISSLHSNYSNNNHNHHHNNDIGNFRENNRNTTRLQVKKLIQGRSK